MPSIPILMPQLGESIAEATVVKLLLKAGDTIEADQEVMEVETNKATMGVTTLCGGTISQLTAQEGVSYAVGSVLGYVEATEDEMARTGVSANLAEEKEVKPSDEEANLHFKIDGDDYHEPKPIEPNVQGLPVPAGTRGAHYISPRMRARMDELGLQAADISAIVGSGAGGRVTVEDLEKFIDYIQTWPSSKASPMRRAVADAMRRSWTRPLATVGLPIVLDKVLQHRSEQNPKPGLTLYFLRAFALALKNDPASAGYLLGASVVHPRGFDIGVAVQVDDGVLVPLIRNADTKTLTELQDEYQRLVELARNKKITREMTSGGIATVTNFGTFGLTWGTPIPLPNETLILGIGAGVKTPVWSDSAEAFLPVTQAELNLTFDHRVVDGGGAGLVLQEVKRLLQNPAEL